MKYIRVLGFTLLIFLLSCTSEQMETKSEKAQQIEVEKIISKQISQPIFASGKVIPASEKKLSFKTGGIIKNISAKEGTAVKKGKLLASLDLSEIKPGYDKALNGFEKAKRDFERVKNLYADSVASLEQYQDSKTALDVAESNLAIASFNLENSKIVAPSDGVILKKLAEEKEIVNQGMPVILFGANDGNWSIKVGVSDKNIVRMGMRDSVSISLDVHPDEQFFGKITVMGSMANPYNGTYDVEIEFQPGDIILRQGYVGKVSIYPSEKHLYKVIPLNSLVEGSGKSGYVFTYNENNRAKKLPVEVAFINENEIALKDAPAVGTPIASTGAQYLTDNSLINISGKQE